VSCASSNGGSVRWVVRSSGTPRTGCTTGETLSARVSRLGTAEINSINESTGIHDRDRIAHMSHDRYVVRDEGPDAEARQECSRQSSCPNRTRRRRRATPRGAPPHQRHRPREPHPPCGSARTSQRSSCGDRALRGAAFLTVSEADAGARTGRCRTRRGVNAMAGGSLPPPRPRNDKRRDSLVRSPAMVCRSCTAAGRCRGSIGTAAMRRLVYGCFGRRRTSVIGPYSTAQSLTRGGMASGLRRGCRQPDGIAGRSHWASRSSSEDSRLRGNGG
jgi:hypothetical protein